jgi:DNA-binding MarR family transcriptional regulator
MLEATDKPDHESRVVANDHVALKLWLRMLTCTSLIEARIRRELRRSFESTLPRFDLMAQLERCSDGLRMVELSHRLMVTGGNVTGLADQLQTEGLLARESVVSDRRATRLRLTGPGRRRFADMARAHEDWVAEMFDTLSREEQTQLLALLAKLKLGLKLAPATTTNSSTTIKPGSVTAKATGARRREKPASPRSTRRRS